MNQYASNPTFENGYNYAPFEDALEAPTATDPWVAYPNGGDVGAFQEAPIRLLTPLLDDPDNIAFGEALIDNLPMTGASEVDEATLGEVLQGWTESSLFDAWLGDNSQSQDALGSGESLGLPISQEPVPSPPHSLAYPWDLQRLDYDPAPDWLGINPNASSFGSQPNEINNRYQYGPAAWNATAVQPTMTVAQTLGGTTTDVPPASSGHTTTTHTTPHHADNPYISITSLSIVDGGFRYCVLNDGNGVPCKYYCTMSKNSCFASHILNTHIGVELKTMHVCRLNRTNAQVLFTKERVRRAEEYAWRCPAAGCFVRMRDDTVRRHSLSRHPHSPVLAFQWGTELETTPWRIVEDILNS